jgi:hypothetical protein
LMGSEIGGNLRLTMLVAAGNASRTNKGHGRTNRRKRLRAWELAAGNNSYVRIPCTATSEVALRLRQCRDVIRSHRRDVIRPRRRDKRALKRTITAHPCRRLPETGLH